MNKSKSRSRTLQFRLSVKDVEPEIWRKVLIPSDTTLAKLHSILQVLMGWNDNHLYAFVINKRRYSSPTEYDGVVESENSIKTKLSSISAKGAEFITYEYDFGDRWEIQLCMEPGREISPLKQSAECIEGSRRGPVEDSGGSRGYMEKAKIYANAQHKRHLEVRKLIGPNFDPEAFDLIRTNEMLKAIV
jgi:hypothetical protein